MLERIWKCGKLGGGGSEDIKVLLDSKPVIYLSDAINFSLSLSLSISGKCFSFLDVQYQSQVASSWESLG
jgi:hypothetical protein